MGLGAERDPIDDKARSWRNYIILSRKSLLSCGIFHMKKVPVELKLVWFGSGVASIKQSETSRNTRQTWVFVGLCHQYDSEAAYRRQSVRFSKTNPLRLTWYTQPLVPNLVLPPSIQTTTNGFRSRDY